MIFHARTAMTPAKGSFPADKTCTFSKKGAFRKTEHAFFEHIDF